MHIGVEEEFHGQGLLGISGGEPQDRPRLVGYPFTVPILGEAEVLDPLKLRVGAGQQELFTAMKQNSHIPYELDRLTQVKLVKRQPAFTWRSAVEKLLHRFFGYLGFDDPTVDLVHVIQADLAVAQVLRSDRQRITFEQEVGIFGNHHHFVPRVAVRLRDLGDTPSARKDVVIPGLGTIGLDGHPVRFPGKDAAGRGTLERLRVRLMLEEALDAVVDELVASILKHLPHDQAGGMAHAFRFRTRRLQPTQLLDHLVEQHHYVATGKKAIEGVRVFDKGRGVRDVHRAG